MAAVHPPKHQEAVPDQGSAAERRLRALIENEPECVKLLDARGVLLEMNAAGLRMIEADSATRVLGQCVYSIVSPEHREAFRDLTERVCRGERGSLQFEITGLHGALRWLETHAVPFRDEASGEVRLLGITRDITERKQAEDALQALLEGTASVTGEPFFAALVRSIARAVRARTAFVTELLPGARVRILAMWSGDRLADPAEYALAHTPCELVFQHGLAFYPDAVQASFPRDPDLTALGAVSYLGIAMVGADGRSIGHVCVLDDKPMADERRTAALLRIFVSRAAAELERTQAGQALRQLMDRLVGAQEAERRRVAGDLHDLIGQNLTALGIDLQTLKQQLPAGAGTSASRIDAMAALVETTIDAIRGVMTDLRPAALEEFGLVPALRWYAATFAKRTGMKVAVQVAGREARLPADAELAVFRVVQEALTNAAKHSGGSAVDISLVPQAHNLRVTVEDDGRGFPDPAGARRGGFGLPTMRERIEARGGTLRVEQPGRGTRLVIEMPVGGDAD